MAASGSIPSRMLMGCPGRRTESVDRDVGQVDAVDGRTVAVHPPPFEHAELRVALVPPGWRQAPPGPPEVAGAGPRPQMDIVDPDADVTRPVGVVERRLAAHLGRHRQRFDRRPGRDAIREPVLDVTRTEPDELGLQPVRLIERRRVVHQADQPGRSGQPAGRFDLDVRIRLPPACSVRSSGERVDRPSGGRPRPRHRTASRPCATRASPDGARNG